jgi:ATP-dependent DNA helicase RecQ
MTYGLPDVVNQRRMIDESPAGEAWKRGQRAKLDALLALAEAHDCRRVRLLAYFGEASAPCGNCDNCLTPPITWDGTLAARKVLSCIYRFHQHNGLRFGAGHLIDVLRGKETEKVIDYRHRTLSTYGIGADLSESEWRAVVRQLLALGHLQADGDFQTLGPTASSLAVMKGEIPITLRKASEKARRTRGGKKNKATTRGQAKAAPVPLDAAATERFHALKAWRATVAKEHNLPAYIVFHDGTLAEMARAAPRTLSELGSISGVGVKKLEAYGPDILQLMAAATGSRR